MTARSRVSVAVLHVGRVVGPDLAIDELGGELDHVRVRLGGGQMVEQARVVAQVAILVQGVDDDPLPMGMMAMGCSRLAMTARDSAILPVLAMASRSTR